MSIISTFILVLNFFCLTPQLSFAQTATEKQTKDLEHLEDNLANRWKCVCTELPKKEGEAKKTISTTPVRESSLVKSCAEAHKVCLSQNAEAVAKSEGKLSCSVFCKSPQ